MKTLLQLAGALLSLCLCTHPILAQTTLFVNEIMASNNTGITDATGAHEDWFEIYNPNNHVVDIAGYYLSDKTATPKKYKMPSGHAETIIQPHGFLRIWASEQPTRGPLHAGFALSASGESVVLSAPDGTLIDAVTFGAQTTDYSYGRTPDGTNNWSLYSIATPGATNAGGTTYQPKLAAPIFSVPAGFKTVAFQLSITHPESGVTIRYTTDGSEPVESSTPEIWKYKNSYKDNTAGANAPGVDLGLLEESNQSNQYVGPIQIVDRSSQANRVAQKSSTSSFIPSYLPDAPIYKGTVIRAKAFKAGAIPSETVTKTYFISPLGGSRYSMPVISLVSNERSFFDYTTGIYNAGRQYDLHKDEPMPLNGCIIANFTADGEDAERRGSFEFIDQGTSVFSQENIGFRIHGNCSRLATNKTLRIYSDTRFNYNFFPGQTVAPKRLLLRGGGNEPTMTGTRDLFIQKLVDKLPFDSQKSREALLFINGEYWGPQPIRERYDKYYLEDKYNVDGDDVDLIQVIFAEPKTVERPGYEAEEGDVIGYKELLDFVNTHALEDPANYETLKTMIDLENYTDYQISQMFMNNVDWPRHNIRLWRTKTKNQNPNAPYGHDGRWRWMLFDCEWALFSNVNTNGFINAASGDGSPVLFKKLLLNPDYQRLISNRVADLLNTHFIPSRSLDIFDQVRAAYTPLMPEYISRWKEKPGGSFLWWNLLQTTELWNAEMNKMRAFLNDRPVPFRESVRTTFGTELVDFTLTVNVSDKNRGYVKVNSIDIAPSTPGISANPYPWTGIYFQTVPIKVVAIAKDGNHFVGWEGPNGFRSTDPTLTFTSTSSALSYKAVFEIDPELVALTLSDGQLSPSFAATTFTYKAAISSTVQSLTVTPTMSVATSKIEVSVNDGAYAIVTNNVATSALPMDPGYNFIRIKVTALDGVTTKIYTIVVNRPMSAPGNALSFDGTDDYVTIGDNSLGNFRQNAFTIEMNIRTSKKTGSGSVLNKRNLCNTTSYVDMIIADGKLKFVSCSNTTGLNYNSIVGTTPVADGKWHHIAVTRFGTLISLYVDGNLDIAFTASGVADIDNTINPDPIKIGNSICGDKYNGSIDELRIWNVARTAQQIADAMLVEVPATSTGLVAYYSFDQGKASLSNAGHTALYEKTVNGYDGTLTNFSLTGGVSNWMESYAMVLPVLTSATNITATGFTANWTSPVTGTASNYVLETALIQDFPFVYQSFNVTGNSQVISNLNAGATYYYRLRANKSSVEGQGRLSKSASVTTPSSNVNLSGLAINHGTLSPGFSLATTNYNGSIDSSVESVQVTPTTVAVGATLQIRLNNGSYTSISSGNASASLPMDPGINIIYIKVIAQDGITEKIYTITVTKPFNPPGNALSFSGSKTDINQEEYVQINKKIDSPNFTLETWMRTSDNSMTGTQGFASTALFNADKGGTANDFTMGILNNKITFFDGNANQTTTGETNVADGRWHHVAVVRDAGISIKIYVDGKLDKENTSGAGTAALNDNSYIALGGNPGYAPAAFHGTLDEVRIWNTARTVTELQQNMFGPISPVNASLKAYYDFDTGTNDPTTVLTDLTGNGNTGTLTNFERAGTGWVESYAMVVPVPAAGSAINTTDFTANWSAPVTGTAERYFLDVSTSENFAAGSFLPGYEALEVNATSEKVTLPTSGSGRQTAGVIYYYYRVSADKTSVFGQGAHSPTITVTFNPLPVTLVSFRGKRVEKTNVLEWVVTDEKQFAGYEVERSIDGKKFGKIGQVKAVANEQSTTTQYQFIDELISAESAISGNLYYRLKMIDLDGSFAMSRIVAIKNDANQTQISSVYPNPLVNKTGFVDINMDQVDSWETHIVNTAGIVLSARKLDLQKGFNKVSFDLKGILPGVHLIKFDNGVQRIVRKIMVE